MNLTPFEGFLAALADSEFSWIFYLIAVLQTGAAAYYLIAGVRRKRLSAVPAILSSLVLPIMLVAGFYFATRPVA
jgi:hypothetical protein